MNYIPTETGHWVSEKFLHLSEILQDYDPNLSLRWIPTDKRTRQDGKPYVIVYHNKGKDHAVRYVSELEDPANVLAQLWMDDSQKNDINAILDARERARRAFELKKELDEREAQQDYAAFLVKPNGKNYVKTRDPWTGEKKKFDDELRPMPVGPKVVNGHKR